MTEVSVTVSIDTEEDNWGSFAESGATSRNIEHLRELQALFARWGARPTYLVNRPPLMAAESVEVLGTLAALPEVEIGAHCHPWNTPPSTGAGEHRSMMCHLPADANRAKVAEMTQRLKAELGVRARSFRAGRWGFGSSVSVALAAEGYLVDSSVTPFVDWTKEGGPDYTDARNRPYRFDPADPFVPNARGAMVEIPTTIGFLSGDHRGRNAIRRRLERHPIRRLKVIGVLDRLGLLRRRWLSPETTGARDMIGLAEACLKSGEPVLDITFHSCTLLPGATPFVRDAEDRRRFLSSLDAVLRFCSESGLRFRTLSEVGESVLAADGAYSA